MKEIWKYLIPSVLGIFIGLLLYPAIFKKPEPIVPPAPPETVTVVTKPDTVIRIVER